MKLKKIPLALMLYKAHTFSELNSFKEYISHSDKNIKTSQQEFEKEFTASEITNVSDSSQDDYWNYEYLKINEIFPSFFRQTTFFGLYSFLETRLHSLCDNLQRLKSYKIKVSDLGGENYIVKSKKYLELVVGLNLDDLNTSWTKITGYQKIRNCFIHNKGNITNDKSQPLNKQKTYNIVKANVDLEIEHDGTIKITNNDFLFNFLIVIEKYIQSLLEKIKTEFEFKLDLG